MKKIVFVLSMMVFGTMSLTAQEATKAKSCSKGEASKCCASKAKTASVDTKVLSAAESLAESDTNITKRVCAESGSMAFYKKSVCETSGKISYDEVKYDEAKMQFVNVSPNDIGDANQGQVFNVVNKGNTKEQKEVKSVIMPTAQKQVAKKSCSKKEGAKCCSKDKAAKKVENN